MYYPLNLFSFIICILTMNSETLDALWKFAEEKLGSNDLTHDLGHTRRVYNLAIKLSKQVGADLDIIMAAAILHDTGRPEEKSSGISHAKISADYARKLLESLDFPTEKIPAVCDAIRTHRFSEGLTPNSLEGKVLSDADKLDAMGAIGLYRTIANNVRKGYGLLSVLKHLNDKLLKLKDLIYLEPAKVLAQKRHKLLLDFVCQIVREYLETETDLPELIIHFKKMCDI